MARTIADIQQSMIDNIQSNATLSTVLTSTSKVSIWRLWTYIVAVCQWTIENLQDLFKSDVTTLIATLKPHTKQWYASKVLAFQYGYDLPADSDVYDNSALTADQITASQVVSYCAVVDVIINNQAYLRIKVAGTNNGDLAALPDAQLTALQAYLAIIKDAGVKLLVTTGNPDGLKQSADIYYNPLVLNNNGNRLDGTGDTPVQDAINAYLKNLPFNGRLTLQSLVDALQVVDGVSLINIKSASAQYGSLPYTSFAVWYDPDSGYMRFINDGDLQLNFIPYNE